MDAPKDADEVVAMLEAMPLAERQRVAAALASEKSAGSEEIDGAHTKLKHALAAEKTWVYDGHDEQATLDEPWIDELNDNESNFAGAKIVFQFTSEKKCGGKINFEVNLKDMTIENLSTHTKSKLHRMEMRVLCAKDMLAEDATTEINALQKNGWTMHWQVKDEWGWKNMNEDVNHTLLTEFGRLNPQVEVTHKWIHPKKKMRLTTIYDVDINEEEQTSRDGKKNKRAVRLVAMREWDRHN